MKDMVQNHLMEAMALVLMEQPARIDADSFRDVRVEALRAVATPTAERMRSDTIRARYTAGTIGSRQVPSYVDEPGVDPSRNTETYASADPRREQPPVGRRPVHPALRQGPRGGLRRDRHPLPPAAPLPASTSGPASSRTCSGWDSPSRTCGWPRRSTAPSAPPRPGSSRRRSTPPRFTAYAHLILEMLNSDPMLFIRGDEAEEAWRIIDPVMTAWSAGEVPMQEYAAGQAPPGPRA